MSTANQNEDDSNIDMAEIETFLRDANMLEPNMSKEIIMTYYKALKNSKTTATAEDKVRKLKNSEENLKKLLNEDDGNSVANILEEDSTQIKSVDSALEDNKKSVLNSTVNNSPKDATKMVFGFNEMPPDSTETLAILDHKLKFVTVQHREEYLRADMMLKTKMLYAYHTRVQKMKSYLARLSFYWVPLPKGIEISSSKFSYDFPETYTCRSGRQIKRKVYNYDSDEDSVDSTDVAEAKKMKNNEEEEWLSKTVNAKSNLRVIKKQEASKSSSEIKESEGTAVNTKKKKTGQKKEEEKKTPQLENLSNADIMKRSRLFGDPQKKRCELMFDKLKEEEAKKEREERIMEVFNKTLEKFNEEESNEGESQSDVITVDDEVSVKRRVVPPLPKAKTIRKQNISKNLPSPSPLTIKVRSHTKSVEAVAEHNGTGQDKNLDIRKTYLRRRPALHRTPQEVTAEAVPSTSQTAKVGSSSGSVECPICNDSFLEEQIEEHAATCGEEPLSRANYKIPRITCEICDKVISINADYNEHVKECIAKNSRCSDRN